jgi:hypothetical protein
MGDQTALSYWFPKLVAAGVPVPQTILLDMAPEAVKFFRYLVHGECFPEGGEAAQAFSAQVAQAAQEFGYPCFLRTDHTSGKHNWDKTCFLQDGAGVSDHIAEIVMYSELAGIVGLPYQKWAVRELLPSRKFGTCPFYSNMPLAREFRVFVDGPEVVCIHPYWPQEALDRGGAVGADHGLLCALEDEAEVRRLASLAGAAVGGAFSVDVLDTERGWFVIDMAEAHKSFHWEGCASKLAEPVSP